MGTPAFGEVVRSIGKRRQSDRMNAVTPFPVERIEGRVPMEHDETRSPASAGIPEAAVETLRIVYAEMINYRKRNREAVIAFGTIAAALAYFLGKAQEPSIELAPRIAIGVLLALAALIVCAFLAVSRSRGLQRRSDFDKLFKKLHEGAAADFSLHTPDTKGPKWLTRVTRQYYAMVAGMALGSLVIIFHEELTALF